MAITADAECDKIEKKKIVALSKTKYSAGNFQQSSLANVKIAII